jgi:NAD(P)-dependent dehydrogenase (short-subunit alcohol dehydrogenase family)
MIGSFAGKLEPMNNTTVLITGALTGIGRATALAFAHEGARVVVSGRHENKGIVNVSSTYGRAGAPGAALYVASKHAVEGLTKAAALEYAESGVRINVVAPGTTETGMLNRFTGTPENKAGLISGVPMKRIGQPEEIAEAILFVGSNKASYITGASLAVDGGKLAR